MSKKHEVPMIRPGDAVTASQVKGKNGSGPLKPITDPEAPDHLELEKLCERLVKYEDELKGEWTDDYKTHVAIREGILSDIRKLVKEIRLELNRLHVRRLYGRQK